jgi:hypothetical protein
VTTVGEPCPEALTVDGSRATGYRVLGRADDLPAHALTELAGSLVLGMQRVTFAAALGFSALTCCDECPHGLGAYLPFKPVSFYETKAMNGTYKEAEALLLADGGVFF